MRERERGEKKERVSEWWPERKKEIVRKGAREGEGEGGGKKSTEKKKRKEGKGKNNTKTTVYTKKVHNVTKS